MLNGLDLFSGIGGLTVALQDFVTPIAYCENDRFAQAVLFSRMREGKLPMAPIWDCVTTLTADKLQFLPDIIYAGFPCQDLSIAGFQKGLEGKRSKLVFEILRLLKETNAQFCFLENVPAICQLGLELLIQEFTKIGYDCRWIVLSAAHVEAPHLRERWWLLAHTTRLQRKTFERNESNRVLSKSSKLPDWSAEPPLCRIPNGVSNRVDRLRGLGNAVVPMQAREAFKKLVGFDA